MKTVGLAMLFGLCCLIGIRIAAKKTERMHTVKLLQRDLQMFSERIASGCGSLAEITSKYGIRFSGSLDRYLDALSGGETEENAAACAAAAFRKGSAEGDGMLLFLSGLSASGRADLPKRVNALAAALNRAEDEAEDIAKQAKAIRVTGALIGAGIVILLL